MQEMNLTQILAVAAAVLLAAAWFIRGNRQKAQVRAALAAGARVIDVRSPAEYSTGHYQGAINIPHDKIGDRLKAVGAPGDTIVVYCASGARSSAAARVLKAKGYSRVINAGGYSAMPV